VSLEEILSGGARTFDVHPEPTEYRLSARKPKVGDEIKQTATHGWISTSRTARTGPPS
jgi:hypothetical protein